MGIPILDKKGQSWRKSATTGSDTGNGGGTYSPDHYQGKLRKKEETKRLAQEKLDKREPKREPAKKGSGNVVIDVKVDVRK